MVNGPALIQHFSTLSEHSKRFTQPHAGLFSECFLSNAHIHTPVVASESMGFVQRLEQTGILSAPVVPQVAKVKVKYMHRIH